jgi:hypothetical protein
MMLISLDLGHLLRAPALDGLVNASSLAIVASPFPFHPVGSGATEGVSLLIGGRDLVLVDSLVGGDGGGGQLFVLLQHAPHQRDYLVVPLLQEKVPIGLSAR